MVFLPKPLLLAVLLLLVGYLIDKFFTDWKAHPQAHREAKEKTLIYK